MKRKAIPAQAILTNRRDNESDLGGVHLIDRSDDTARPQQPGAAKVQTSAR